MADRPREDDDRNDETADQTHPIDPPVSDDERYRLERDARLRNNEDEGTHDEPTLPSNDASLNTKI